MCGVHSSFFVRWEGLAYWVQFLPTYSVAKFHFSNTHAPAISDDSCLFEVRQCATDVRGQADIRGAQSNAKRDRKMDDRGMHEEK